MTAFDFPNAPVPGQTYMGYTWDGEKWTQSLVTDADDAAPSNVPPAMDGAAVAGSSALYSRGDHVHPTDTSRAPLASPVFTGDPRAPTPAAADNDTSIATTAFVMAAVAAGGGGAVTPASLTGKNRILNGRFDVDQRNGGAGNAVAPYTYVVDGWRAMNESGSTYILPLQNNFLPTFKSNGLIQTVAAGNKWGCFQPVELANMRDVAAVPVTLSFLITILNATTMTNMKAAILQWTGTPDAITNPISAWGAAGTNPTLAANWSYVNTPANLNLTLTGTVYQRSMTATPSASARNLAVMVWCDSKTAAAFDWFGLTDVQLEAGSVATQYEVRSFAQELLLAQRYFEKSYNYAVKPGANVGLGNGNVEFMTGNSTSGMLGGSVSCKVTKRAVPSLTLYDNAGAPAKLHVYNGSWTSVSPLWGPGVGDGSFLVGVAANIVTNANILVFDYVMEAGL